MTSRSLLDGRDRTRYAAIACERVAADAFATLSTALGRLVAQARQASTKEPEAATGLLRDGQDVAVVAGVEALVR